MCYGFPRNKALVRSELLFPFIILIAASACTTSQPVHIMDGMRNLRNTAPREWSTFPAAAEQELIIDFDAPGGPWQALGIRQLDVKQDWEVLINSQRVGQLINDEKDITNLLAIPAGLIVAGKNTIQIHSTSSSPDDIMAGDIVMFEKSVQELLSASIEVSVLDKESGSALPARITILDNRLSMAPVSGRGDASHLAIRNGCVYTATGKAQLGVAPGRYALFVTRGFEYGVDSTTVDVHAGEQLSHTFRINREVDTRGWIASDTHVHTLTHSGHGDATDRDRVITLAGEGIELPVITDHNIHIDLSNEALAAGTSKWFTSVIGNEVTTGVGHFNVFPVSARVNPVDPNAQDWETLSVRFQPYSNGVIVLNHANDIHRGFIPFDHSRHVSVAGVRSDNWKCPANAMEVLNSGSQQTDIMKLLQGWFGMLNGGYMITPVGSSDSHDVCRYIVGQGRTYIKGNDNDPARIDIDDAVRNLRQGKVMVSAGLLTKVVVNKDYGPGDMVPESGDLKVDITVTGPSWTRASKVMLFVNGRQSREESIVTGSSLIKWTGQWTIAKPLHDVFLVVIATGPGDNMPFWPIEKPYQPQSPDYDPIVIGSSGAVWIDADGNGIRNPASDYARTILKAAKGKLKATVPLLRNYDEAVACQVAALWWQAGGDLHSQEFEDEALGSGTAAARGFNEFRLDVTSTDR
jgi:hypothetical protein